MTENRFFPEIRGNFGLCCLRLPMRGELVDCDEFERMADTFIGAGFNYFDTAHTLSTDRSEYYTNDQAVRPSFYGCHLLLGQPAVQ